MPVVPAAQDAEAGELLEPKKQRLQGAEIVPLHSSQGDRVRLHLKKQTTTTKKKTRGILSCGGVGLCLCVYFAIACFIAFLMSGLFLLRSKMW